MGETGDRDPLLAATAVHGLVLVTRNMRHFEPIEGLRIENWFAEG
jgi:predicted nucleic acid-binding protein